MFTISWIRYAIRSAPFMLAAAIAGTLAACGGDDDFEPNVQTIRLTISGTAAPVNIDRASGSPTIVIAPGAHTVTATFLRSNGDVETLVTGTEFELRIEGMNAAVATFTRTGPFTGTLTGVAVGTTTAEVQLYHKEEMHEDFERSVTLQVQ